jgi:hypothetical protein
VKTLLGVFIGMCILLFGGLLLLSVAGAVLTVIGAILGLLGMVLPFIVGAAIIGYVILLLVDKL